MNAIPSQPAGGDSHALVSVRGIDVSYGLPAHAGPVLQGVDLEVARGEFLVLLGPSGCGKSTLLKALGGQVRPTAGHIARPPSLRVNMVFQEDGLYPWMRVVDNVAFGLRLRGMGRNERHARALRELRLVGLEANARQFPGQLSGGMRQRVNIARAFANEPDLILMDEPYAALDVQTRTLMQEQLLALLRRTDKTVVFVTHSIEEALLLADRVVVMGARPGRIVAQRIVPFARPRDIYALKRDSRFLDLADELWSLIADDVRAGFQEGAS